MQSTRRMRAWTSPDFRRRLSVAERSCTTTARLSERPAPDASFPAVNFNGQRFVPSATERRIASRCIGLPMKQIARNVTIEGWGALQDCRYLLHDSRNQVYPVVPRHDCVRSSGTACAAGAQPGPECLFGALGEVGKGRRTSQTGSFRSSPSWSGASSPQGAAWRSSRRSNRRPRPSNGL